MVNDEIADGVELAVEVTIEGSAFGTYVSPAVAIAAHVDVGSQLSAGIQMLGCIVGPPDELCAIADFVPAIDGRNEVFLQAVADSTETVLELVRRQCGGVRCVAVNRIAYGLAVAAVA